MTLLQRVIGFAHTGNVDNIPSTMTLEERELMRAKNILWIFGLAGAGKSTVAHTVAKTLTLDGLYLACYFPARDGSDSTPANKLFPTIAHRLALL